MHPFVRTRITANLGCLAFTLALVFAVEMVLRSAGIPRRGALFLTEGNETRLSPGAAARYFAARSPLVPETRSEPFQMPKPARLVRIMCLGGSTMAGYPFTYNGTLPSLLADGLQHIFPDTAIEVLNLAVSAVGSYTVLDLCRHALAYEPDLMVVYTGHNEFYGALGAASTQRLSTPRWLTLLHLRMQDVALYRLWWDTIGKVRRPRQAMDSDVTLMARMVGQPCVPSDSPSYRKAVAVFSANVADLCRLCAKRGVPVVVCELVSNLRDQPPFPVCPLDQAPGWNNSPDSSAATLFAQARSAEQSTDPVSACALYIRARDADWCRFRAPGEFNDSLRAIVPRKGGVLVALKSRFLAASPFPAPGYDLFLDHLHPNLDGYVLVAGSIIHTMREQGILDPPLSWDGARKLTPGVHRQGALVTELEHAIAMDKVRRLMSHWPFSPDQPLPVYVFDDTIATLARRYHDERLAWSDVHFMAADYLVRQARYGEALRETKAVLKQAAGFWPAWMKAGDVYLAQRRPLDAATAYQVASRLDGGRGHSLAKLGSALLAGGNTEEAVSVLEAARRPEAGLSELDWARASYLLGKAYAHLGLLDDAMSIAAELSRHREGGRFADKLRMEMPGG
ncbi:hypothetical protein JXA88_17335 [Candidatus Fermentibacteria bacterium]|nr:hypothetical protein [Candidatus Fermentibacteria bacterium]